MIFDSGWVELVCWIVELFSLIRFGCGSVLIDSSMCDIVVKLCGVGYGDVVVLYI